MSGTHLGLAPALSTAPQAEAVPVAAKTPPETAAVAPLDAPVVTDQDVAGAPVAPAAATVAPALAAREMETTREPVIPVAAVAEVIAPAPVPLAQGLPSTIPYQGASRTKWLVAIAAIGVAGGLGLGLMIMRLASPTPSSAPSDAAASLVAPATSPPAAAAATPVVEAGPLVAAPVPAPAAAADQAPKLAAAAAVESSAASAPIPWDDLPRTTTKRCEELSPVGSGPKGFLFQQAMASAQRALLQGDTAAAHTAFCTAAQIGVPSDTVLLGLTQVLLMQGDLTAALKTVDQLLERAPTNKHALGWRGDILIRMGRVDEARAAWLKAAGATRASKRLIDNLLRASDADAKTALRSGDLSRADRMLRRGIALTSGDSEHCRELAAVLTKSGQAAAAERWRGI